MNPDFNRAYDTLLKHEGGYSNHSSDRGGETYKGIARNFERDWNGWKIIDSYKSKPGFPNNLDQDQELDLRCREIYKVKYWDVNRIDEMMIYPLKYEVFEIGVNMGVGTAGKLLQESLNLLNKQEKLYPNLTIDGKIGPATIRTVQALLNNESGITLVNLINILQGERYINICRNNESQEVFLRGWLNRIDIVRK